MSTNTTVPITEAAIAEIVERAKQMGNAGDFLALDREIYRLADNLSDCWLLLDTISRDTDNTSLNVRQAAKALLRRQQVPGHK